VTARTRYFVIVSLLVLTVGLGAGLVAYYVGLPMGAFSAQGPDELQLIPRSASLVAFADVHEIMLSDVRQKVLPLLPAAGGQGREELQTQTGINLETDIDHIVAAMVPSQSDQNVPVGGIVLARGRFEDAKIEALMTSHGGQTETYKGKQVIVAQGDGPRQGVFAVGFLDSGLLALGSPSLVRAAIDLKDGGESVRTNDDIMTRVRALDDGNAWAVGRFDALGHGRLAAGLANRLPPITWFSASSRIDGGIRADIRADTVDNDAANNLREVVRGLVALVKMQANSRPGLTDVVNSFNIGGVGNTVSLSFTVPSSAIETLGASLPRLPGAGRTLPH
jgi:hypothetical protein